MSTTLIDIDALVEAPVVNAAVVYDEFNSGCLAKAFFDRLESQSDGMVNFNLALWRMDILHLTGAASAAVRDFACADMVVVALAQVRQFEKCEG